MVGEGSSTAPGVEFRQREAFDTFVKDPRFVERFSRFINAQFNTAPGATPAEDAAYYLTRHILESNRPWADLFTGPFDVVPSNAQQPASEALVRESNDGLGYFRSRAWSVRYAGNEAAGARIVAAYRILQNTIGLTLTATTNAPEVDTSAAGRAAPPCASCHGSPWFALDKVAEVLGTRKGQGNELRFEPPKGDTKLLLGGIPIANDRDLVETLVRNEAFFVHGCRLAFRFAYGRNEYSCEGALFDTCVQTFRHDPRITSALGAVIQDPSFCE
jgi:hypothetical protein